MRFFTIFVWCGSSLLASRHGDLREHTRTATMIVLGEITGSRSYYGSDGDIYSDVTINVSSTLKNTGRKAAKLQTFTVKGGTVGGTSVIFTDVPVFDLNESAVVFFEGDLPSSKYAIRGGWMPELGESAGKVLGEIEQTLLDQDTPVAESERQRTPRGNGDGARTRRCGLLCADRAQVDGFVGDLQDWLHHSGGLEDGP